MRAVDEVRARRPVACATCHHPHRTSRRAGALFATLLATVPVSGSCHAAEAHPDGVTVAFVGDQGTDENARAVLRLIADRGADLLLLQGDFGYERGSAARWIRNLEEALGPDFPVLGVVGNHENHEWPIYRRWLAARVDAIDALSCEGDIGVKAICSFRGITIAQVAPGVHEVGGVAPDDDYAGYLERELANAPNRWRLCSWHKNQREMQVGDKEDEAGWAVYEACRRVGGIVATGHEHSYSRTYLMSDFRHHEVVHHESTLDIGPGRSFAFVSGLGGHAIRDQQIDGDWWASVYSATQNATHGALFCTFVGIAADCWFEDVAGGIADRFSLVSHTVPGDGSPRSLARAPRLPGDRPVTGGTGSAFGLLALLAAWALCAERTLSSVKSQTAGLRSRSFARLVELARRPRAAERCRSRGSSPRAASSRCSASPSRAASALSLAPSSGTHSKSHGSNAGRHGTDAG